MVSVQGRPDAGVPVAQAYSDSLDLVVEAERLGVDDVWLTEHHGAPDGYCPAPNVVGGAFAARTHGLGICHAVALAPLQGHPLRLAEDYAVVDNLSGGRVEIGLGQGYRPEEFAAFGLPYERRTRAFEECLDILDLAWTGEAFDYAGDVYETRQGRLSPAPLVPGRPPLWLGAATPRSRERVLRRRAGLVISLLTDHEHTRRQFDAFERQAEVAGAPGLPRALIRELFIADSDDEAVARVAPYLDYVYRVEYTPERTGMTYVDRRTGERRRITSSDDPYFLSREFVDDRFVVGSPETCARRLSAIISEMRLDRLIFRPQFPGQPLAAAVETMERMMTEVVPLIDAPR